MPKQTKLAILFFLLLNRCYFEQKSENTSCEPFPAPPAAEPMVFTLDGIEVERKALAYRSVECFGHRFDGISGRDENGNAIVSVRIELENFFEGIHTDSNTASLSVHQNDTVYNSYRCHESDLMIEIVSLSPIIGQFNGTVCTSQSSLEVSNGSFEFTQSEVGSGR